MPGLRDRTVDPIPPRRVSTGVSGFDDLGGGPGPGTSLLLPGPSGCGESAVAAQHAHAAAKRGERSAVFAHGLVSHRPESPIDVSYLADSVLLFRHFEAASQVRKALSVVKKRVGGHESAIRPALEDIEGVLGGAPTYVGEGGAGDAPLGRYS